MNRAAGNLKEGWNKIPHLAKMVIYALILAVGIFILVSLFMPERYQTLYTGLEPQDSLDIQQSLSTKGIDYKLSEEGTSILVDGDIVMIKRDLALENLPQGGTSGGLSQFDELSIGSTTFDKEVQYQNRLQQDLQSSIVKAFSGVQKATVKLPRIEEKSIFAEEENPVKISVALQMKNGSEMTPENVKAVQVFVAASVQQVKAEDVEVVDSNMNVLSGEEGSSFTSGSSKQMQIADATKEQLEKQLQRTLGNVYGKVEVIANVDINFDEIVQNIEKYDPEGTLLSRETGSEAVREADRGSLGEVGTDQNGEVPRYEIEDLDEGDVLYAQDKENLIENFAVGKTVEKIIKYPELRNTNVAVWVDSDLTNLEIEELEEMISISSGLTGQAARDLNNKAIYDNGSVKVTQTAFALTELEEETVPEDTGFEMKWWYWVIAGVILLILIVLAVMAILAARRRKKELAEALEEQRLQEMKQTLENAKDKANPGMNADEVDYEAIEKNKERFKFEWTNKQTGLREATNEVSTKFPKETADVIKKFLRDADE